MNGPASNRLATLTLFPDFFVFAAISPFLGRLRRLGFEPIAATRIRYAPRTIRRQRNGFAGRLFIPELLEVRDMVECQSDSCLLVLRHGSANDAAARLSALKGDVDRKPAKATLRGFLDVPHPLLKLIHAPDDAGARDAELDLLRIGRVDALACAPESGPGEELLRRLHGFGGGERHPLDLTTTIAGLRADLRAVPCSAVEKSAVSIALDGLLQGRRTRGQSLFHMIERCGLRPAFWDRVVLKAHSALPIGAEWHRPALS